MFKNRQEAGKRLAVAVAASLNRMQENTPARTVVIALSRGGVLVAREVAGMICAPLTILVSKLITAPFEPDKNIAAVSSRGVMVLSDIYDESIEGLPSYLRGQQLPLAKMSKTLEEHWLEESHCPQPPIAGRRLILINDGTVTGLTELVAIRSVKPEKPRRIIVATPVVSHAVERKLSLECNLVVALAVPEEVKSLVQHYGQYEHVEDKDIIQCLRAINRSAVD